MKRTRFIVLIIALVGATSAAGSIKLCQLDWFKAWQDKISGTLSGSTYAAVSSYGSQAEVGTWSVTSDEGSPGVKHTVSGMSQCASSSGTTSTNQVMWSSDTLANNKNCWCRMSAPNLGASWVFLSDNGSAAHCASYCAHLCAVCVQLGAVNSCSRSALLELP
ncbi:MAG: hypothetical protein LBL21_01750 [Rickettsiales bacterium]|jgi:hypothetical protein|nr:hypothetical protein [Rickettsiales bacterium]